MTEEIFSQCCLNKKCICKLCYIPDCHDDGEVVVELLPESIDMPGHCCGKYECQKEPNCTEVQNTDSYWLTNCQRCKCYGGHRLCHQSCDEDIKKPAMCHSINLNTFYEHGQSWRDGCYDCECVNGEANCMITFCKGLNCPKNRQIQLKDRCCPVCWPEGFPIPNVEEEYDEEHNDNEIDASHRYDNNEDYNENEDQVEPDIELKPINDLSKVSSTENINSSSTTITTTTTSTTTTTKKPSTTETPAAIPAEVIVSSTSTPVQTPSTSSPCKVENPSSTTPEPCNRQEVPATYQVYPQVVELMRYSQHNNLLYTIIGCLSVIVVILAAWNIHLKAKQRSYRPVSNFDDNFNRMSSNIKKMNDYV